jgi:hypothetical protein
VRYLNLTIESLLDTLEKVLCHVSMVLTRLLWRYQLLPIDGISLAAGSSKDNKTVDYKDLKEKLLLKFANGSKISPRHVANAKPRLQPVQGLNVHPMKIYTDMISPLTPLAHVRHHTGMDYDKPPRTQAISEREVARVL